MADMVRLQALKRIWMGDGVPLVQRGETFTTDAEAARALIDKGFARRARVRRPVRKSEEEKGVNDGAND